MSIFLGIVSIWALIEGQIATTEDLRWLIPLPWVIAGGAGLIVIMFSRGGEPSPVNMYASQYATEPVPAPDYTSDLEAKLETEAAQVQIEPDATADADESDESDEPEVPPDR